MKKLFSLLLCLALFLPVMAMAEAEVTPELYTIDLGDFTIGLYEGDYYEVAPEKTNNAVYAMIYPAYDASAASHDNFNVVWCKDDAAAGISLYGAEAYANLVLQASQSQYEAMGIKMSDAQVLSAVLEDGVGAFITTCNLDYTGAGVNLISPMYQLQTYFCKGETGTYIFTFSASTLEDLEAMSSYLDSVEFK